MQEQVKDQKTIDQVIISPEQDSNNNQLSVNKNQMMIETKIRQNQLQMLQQKKQQQVKSTFKIMYFKQDIKQEWELMAQNPVVTDLKLYQDNYKRSEILKTLAFNTQFPNLKDLSLANNNIESIQPLQIMFMPCLQKMNLQQNCFSCLISLRKTNVPNIQQISIKSKVIYISPSDIFNQLSQGNFSNLKKINLKEEIIHPLTRRRINLVKQTLQEKARNKVFKKFKKIPFYY